MHPSRVFLGATSQVAWSRVRRSGSAQTCGAPAVTSALCRDGTHAEQVILPVDGVARRPAKLSAQEAAAVGVPFVTAWSALVEAGRLTTGE